MHPQSKRKPAPASVSEMAIQTVASEGIAIPAGRRCLVAAMLGASLVCNVAALIIPFMELRVGLSRAEYSLPRSVKVLWDSNLFLLAILVVGFSVVFPFAKLLVLGGICAAKRVRSGHRFWLATVERLGKWSMLDVFLVCLILTLTSNQLLVGARPLFGIPLFAFAVVLSMVCGELLSEAIGKSEAATKPEPARPGAIGACWLALTGIALIGALGMPFLAIDDWTLVDRSRSIISIVPTLWVERAFSSAVLVALFLVLIPIMHWVCAAAAWVIGRRGKADNRFRRHAMLLKRWNMLDVFGLALAVFLVEGNYLMRTEVSWGALFLVALLGMRLASELALYRVMLRPARESPGA